MLRRTCQLAAVRGFLPPVSNLRHKYREKRQFFGDRNPFFAPSFLTTLQLSAEIRPL
jgi:hypothetical protein